MSLEPLSEVESEELVASLLGRADLPSELPGQISHAAEGNPLFVEELLGKLIDDGFLVTDRRRLVRRPATCASSPCHPPSRPCWPPAWTGSAARSGSVIERAAVEGKVFHRGAVTELAPEPMRPPGSRSIWRRLMRMELVRPDQASFAGEEAYRFRHLLIRDAAYQALAKQTRSELHERFAAWLERVAADRSGRVRGDRRLPPRAGLPLPGRAGSARRPCPGACPAGGDAAGGRRRAGRRARRCCRHGRSAGPCRRAAAPSPATSTSAALRARRTGATKPAMRRAPSGS